jgi:hypothetical protein
LSFHETTIPENQQSSLPSFPEATMNNWPSGSVRRSSGERPLEARRARFKVTGSRAEVGRYWAECLQKMNEQRRRFRGEIHKMKKK